MHTNALTSQYHAPHLGKALALTLAIAQCCSTALAQSSDPEKVEEVVVLGRGETRQVQSIRAEQIDVLPSGTSPLKAIERLPGVNFQSADPYGAYEWSARITVRGFGTNQLGYTLDGVPLGDMTYGNHNGLHISRAVPSENVDRVQLSQGAGSLDIASTSNLGGAIEFFSADPVDDFGVDVEQMIGSDSARRTFVRLDTGELGTGTRAYIAAVDASTDKWKGGGDQEQRQYNLKVVQPVGAAQITAFYNYSDRVEIDYQDMSFAMIERRGWDWDNWYPNWNAAVGAAQACNAGGQSDATVCDDAYWNASGLREDDLGYVKLDVPFGESVKWSMTGYIHRNEGQGLWGTPYTPTPGGSPLSIRTTEYDMDRKGGLTSLALTFGAHEIGIGAWYETVEFTQARRFYGEPSRNAPTRDFEDMQRNPLLTQWEYDFDTETTVFYLQDTMTIADRFRINAGFRSVQSENEAVTIVGDPKSGSIEAKESFLPQLGFNWTLNDANEVFVAAARNMRAFVGSGTSGPFSTTAAGFNAIRDVIEPETSTNYEVGWRFHGGRINASLTAYHVDFDDRLVGVQQGPSIVGNPSVLANVGSVKTNGLEGALNLRVVDDFTWFTSLAWNDSQYDNNYSVTSSSGTTVIATKGKQVVDAPELLAKTELMYDNGNLFVRVDGNFTDERYYTYLNDRPVDAYTIVNAGVGIRLRGLGVMDTVTIQGDITNITDKKYISTIGSGGFFNDDPAGSAMTLLRGAPRQYFLSVKANF
ncbi:MAG TPA: TonB-dependent receptor [Steroidobacteraceae bacterium]|nr:TonB-dependent receptor [Steroidobacteraceae bacterium]